MAQDKDDVLARFRFREFAIMALITIQAVLANLPREYLEETLGIDYHYVLGTLVCTVVIGLFLYLKFFYLVAVILLIVGANLPDQVAEHFGMSKVPLILALVAMVGVSLVNYVVKKLPTGLEPKPKEKSPEGIRALFYGIEKNNVAYAQKVLSMNFDPNLRHDNGYTPLAYAAMKGNPQMVDLLLRSGAEVNIATADGDTPVELALRMGHAELADQLKRVRVEQEARAAGGAAPAPAQST